MFLIGEASNYFCGFSAHPFCSFTQRATSMARSLIMMIVNGTCWLNHELVGNWFIVYNLEKESWLIVMWFGMFRICFGMIACLLSNHVVVGDNVGRVGATQCLKLVKLQIHSFQRRFFFSASKMTDISWYFPDISINDMIFLYISVASWWELMEFTCSNLICWWFLAETTGGAAFFSSQRSWRLGPGEHILGSILFKSHILWTNIDKHSKTTI